MTDEVLKRMTELSQPMIAAFDMCQSRDDILMLASYMMTTAHKMFVSAFESEELASEFMIQYLIDHSPRPPLKKIV